MTDQNQMIVDENVISTKSKYLCNLCDCVSIGNKGDTIVQSVFAQFTHSNCYINRIATKKTLPGSVLIKGDGKKNRYVINMFVQFYPGSPKYPNDNIIKRVEWFVACLDKILEIPDAESFSFPINIGMYENADYVQRYINLIDDFRKKYYLRHTKIITIHDYQGNDFFIHSKKEEEESIKYDKPIEIIKMEMDDPFCFDQSQAVPKINVIQHIELNKLRYINEQSSINSATKLESENINEPKIKLDLKKNVSNSPKITIAVKTPVQSQTTLKNSLLTNNQKQNIPSNADEYIPKLNKNMLADDNDDDKEVIKKSKISVKNKNPVTSNNDGKVSLEKKKIKSLSGLGRNMLANDTDDEPIKKKKSSIEIKKPIENKPKTNINKTIKCYDKNPSWKKTISELANEIDESWDLIFKDPKMMSILSQLDKDFEKEMEAFGDHLEILPSPQNLIFNAFNLCSFPPKCIIIGQDPYYSNLNEAMGLSFSVPSGIKHPPSLENIFKELSTDISGFNIPTKSGDLTKWAMQGVLLLNTSLTVRYKQKEAHIKQWKDFTDLVIKIIDQNIQQSMVIMMWGSHAKTKKALIKSKKIQTLEATHPSPLGANQGGWFGCKHFSKCNDYLKLNQIEPINWIL